MEFDRIYAEVDLGRIEENMKAMMQASYDAVIASGGTKKAAKAAANDTKAEINRALLDMQSRGSNYKVAFDLADNKAAEKLDALRANAEAAKKSLAGMGTLSAVFSAIGAGIAKAGFPPAHYPSGGTVHIPLAPTASTPVPP